MSIIPVTVPTGAIRFNTDSNKMECFNGTKWMQIAVSSPDLDGGSGRGLVMQGIEPAQVNSVSYVDITATGTGLDFGDATANKRAPAGCASRTRALSGGGNNPSVHDEVDYFTFTSKGNGIDWGDLPTARSAMAALSSATRGIFAGGYTPSSCNIIELVTIASTGSTQDFGDLSTNRWDAAAMASPTRGVFANGTIVAANDQVTNIIDFVTIASTGNAQDFGDATGIKQACPGCSNSTRGIWGGGYTPSGTKNLDTIEIATTSNAIDFGDLTHTLTVGSAFSSPTRGVWAAGYSGGNTNIMNYVTIATFGDAVDYGDLNRATHRCAGASNSHGGLQKPIRCAILNRNRNNSFDNNV